MHRGAAEAISGLVSRLRLPCIDLRLPGDEAQDPLPEPSATCRTVADGSASLKVSSWRSEQGHRDR